MKKRNNDNLIQIPQNKVDSEVEITLGESETLYIKRAVDAIRQLEVQYKQQISDLNNQINGALNLIVLQKDLPGNWKLMDDLKTIVRVFDKKSEEA